MRTSESNRRRIFAAATFLAAAMLAGASTLSAQGSRGLYLSMGVGFAQGAGTEAALSGPNSPTRCDRLLYPNLADAPRDAGCLAGSELGGLYSFSPEMGLAGSFAVGYALGPLSIEVEALQRHQVIHNTLLALGTQAGDAITGKETEWSPERPPWADISEFRGRQFFANVTYSVPTEGRLTPYVGVGGGLSRVAYRYYLGFARKSIAEGYLEVFGGSRAEPEASPDWQRAAAGTVSELATDVSETGLAFQLLAGVDYALTEQVSIGLKGRWMQTPDVSVNAQWTTIRSHAPVHADGVTPFISTLDFSRLGYWAVGATMKYRL
jgi:opacity protein-like surface antigen